MDDLEVVMEDVGRTHVNLGDHHQDGHAQGQGQSQVLLRHPHDPCIRSHLQGGREGE